MKNMNKRLFRSRENKVISGVCGGIGEYFDIDPIWVRLAFVLLTLINGMGVIVYIVAWILVPENPGQKVGKNTSAQTVVEKVRDKMSSKTSKRTEKPRRNHPLFFGIALIFIGSVLLMKNLFTWFSTAYIFPLALIVFALYLLARS